MARLPLLGMLATVYLLQLTKVSTRPSEKQHIIFEGDMAFTSEQKAIVEAAITTKKDIEETASKKFAATNAAFPKWTNAIMPYTFSPSLSSRARYAVKQGMAEWERATCIRFKQRTSERSYVEFFPGSGCWGHVGMTGTKSQISVGPGCEYRHVMTHEIGHALGFFHEQSRTDRDDYVRIEWGNVPKNLYSAFEKYGRDKLDSLGEKYDYGSIMHYPWNAFSTNGRNTLVPRRAVLQQPYVRLSQSDAIQAKRMYCGKTKPKPATKPPQPPVPSTNPPINPMTECKEVIVTVTEPVGNCRGDRHQSCRSWASRGECSRNPAWMLVNCCTSCGSGSSSCNDKSHSCKWWARRGECRRNPAYMNLNCKKSCRRCSGAKKRVIQKKVRKCTVVPLTEMPPIPTEDPNTEMPPIPTDEPVTNLPPIPTDEPVTNLPPIPTDKPQTKVPVKPQTGATLLPPIGTDKPEPPVTMPPLPQSCNISKAAGLQDGSLSDENLSSTSSFNKGLGAAKGRLGSNLAWCSAVSNDKQFLKIDIGKLTLLKAVSTQGFDVPVPMYVKKFYISYSEDDKLWNNVVGETFWAIKEFAGNSDGKTQVKNTIEPPIVARYIKIHPIEWKNHICLRAELAIC